ncbi:MAG: DegT/DnrJ/EryC1/StrS family aminotransferase, partial [Deltaproteobacteria bacterium]|nr:DegT/DnrJ/EryC1/StrS family aminotransferase [Deltaproteobacteria bacterium]
MLPIPRFAPSVTLAELIRCGVHYPAGGNSTRYFATRFAEYLGGKHTVIAPSGRIALAALLNSFLFRKGREVVLPALTFHSVPSAVLDAGLVPRFVDVRPDTLCLDETKLAAAVSDRTAAVIPTHLYGRACEMDTIVGIAKSYGAMVIEDCAQACGASYRGKKLGSIGDGAFFSFGPTKNISTLWAGAAVTLRPGPYEKSAAYVVGFPALTASKLVSRAVFSAAMRMISRPIVWAAFVAPLVRWYASRGIDLIERATSESPGARPEAYGADRMPRPYQGSLGVSQLTKLDAQNERRIRNGERLLAALRQRAIDGLGLPADAPRGENIFMSFPVRVRERDAFRRALLRRGVDSASGYMRAGPGSSRIRSGPRNGSRGGGRGSRDGAPADLSGVECATHRTHRRRRRRRAPRNP